MTEPDATVEAASDAIDQACAEQQARDPEAAVWFQAAREETTRVLRETFGDSEPKTITVTWTEPGDPLGAVDGQPRP